MLMLKVLLATKNYLKTVMVLQERSYIFRLVTMVKVLVLLFTLSFQIQAQTIECSPSNTDLTQKNVPPKLTSSMCKVEMKLAKCDEWLTKNPDSAPKMKNCRLIEVTGAVDNFAGKFLGCLDGIGNNISDTAKGVYEFLTGKIEMPPEMKDREEYFQACVTPECKRSMLGSYSSLFTPEEIEGHPNDKNLDPNDPVNSTYLNGLSSKTLYRNLLWKLKERFKSEGHTLEKYFEPWSGKEAKLPKNLTERLNDILDASGVTNTTCYDPAVVKEMQCYALLSVLDPFVFAKATVLIAKTAGVVTKNILPELKDVAKFVKNNTVDISTAAAKSLTGLTRKSAATRYPILTKYPAVETRINAANRIVETKVMRGPIKDIYGLVDEEKVQSKLSRAEFRNRINDLDPELKNTIFEVRNRLSDKEAYIKYMEKLSSDVIADIEKRAIPKELEALKRGEIGESATLRVLVKRAQERGEGKISIIRESTEGPSTTSSKPNTTEGFREAVAQGPFFDKPFDGSTHGMSAHFLQRDFISDVVERETNGNPQKFWNHLGSKKGVHFWVPIFDAIDSATAPSLTSPGVMSTMTNHYLKAP